MRAFASRMRRAALRFAVLAPERATGAFSSHGFKSRKGPGNEKRPVGGAWIYMVGREGLEPPARGFSVIYPVLFLKNEHTF